MNGIPTLRSKAVPVSSRGRYSGAIKEASCSLSEIIKLLRSETGITGITKFKRSLYSGGIRKAQCKQILDLPSLFVTFDISIKRNYKGSNL